MTSTCQRCGSQLETEQVSIPSLPGRPARSELVAKECATCAARQAERERIEAAELAARLRRQWIDDSRIEPDMRGLSLDPALWPTFQIDPRNRTVVLALREWVASEASLYVYGPPGTGKTYLAICAAMDALRLGQQVLYMNEADLVKAARQHAGGKSAVDIVERAQAVQTLVLDDFGALEQVTPFMRDVLYMILDKRCPTFGPRRRILITSNLPPLPETRGQVHLDGLLKRYPGPVESRLLGLVDGDWVELTGRDRRQTWRRRGE